MFSIIIPTMQKDTDILNKLLDELTENSCVGEIIIIDNSLNGFTYNSDKIRVIIPKKNLFVNMSWNIGVKEAKYDYIGILNDDILLPKNFLEQTNNFLIKNADIGLCGLDSNILYNTEKSEFNEYPQDSTLNFEHINNDVYIKHWGAAIFGKKKNFYKIPSNLKVWCGDNYLLKKNTDNNKICYSIKNAQIKHLGSLTCNNPDFDKIKAKDIYNYSKIDKRFKEHSHYKKPLSIIQRIFSIKNEGDRKVFRILGFKISKKRKNVLVHFHIFYKEQVDYFVKKLKNINSCNWDLYVTYCDEDSSVKEKITKIKNNANFINVENYGYDIYPFIQVLNKINTNNYDYVLKIHTKGFRTGNCLYGTKYVWRDTLVDALLYSKKHFRTILKIFDKNEAIGMIGAKKLIINMTDNNYPEDSFLFDEICEKYGLPNTKGLFIGGTMFICKAKLLNYLKEINISQEELLTQHQNCRIGTIFHVIERLLGTMIQNQGYQIYGMKTHKPFSQKLKTFLQKIFSIKNENKDNRKIKRLVLLGIKINLSQIRKDSNMFIYKLYTPLRKAKTVCYTCITGNYAQLYSHDYINYNWDYVCFTDNKTLLKKKQIGIWKIRPLVFNKLDNTKNNRWHKMHPHLLFPEYSQSLYVDGNVNILTPYYSKLIAKTKLNMLLPKHYQNDCIYQELDYIVELNKETKEKIDVLRNKYRQEQMPENLGLTENNIIFRKHNEKQIIKIMEEWWSMVENYSKRDQASFMYVIWKNNIDIKEYTFNNARYDSKNCELQNQNYPVMGKSILITGGAGFIGSTLADRLLAEANKVIVIDNFNDYYDPQIKENNVKNNLNNDNYKLYRGNIEDPDFVKKIFDENTIDMVVHIAARAGVRPSLMNPLAYTKTNIDGTVNILEAMQKHDVKKIVFASSSSVYGNCKAAKFSEDLKVTEPISPYAATKSACEQFLYTYSKLYDIQALCLRFFTVFGPRQRPDLAIRKFIELIEQDKPIPVYGDGTTMRDYTYIDDIVEGIMSALKYNASKYEIINLGGGAPVTLNGMIETIERVLGKKAKIDRLPMQPGDVDKTVSDITKAKKLLGYCPQTTFEEGIRKFVEWRKK